MANERPVTTTDEDLRDWLVRQGLATHEAPVQHLVGDVSRRRYLRLSSGPRQATKILALYPPDLRPAYRNFVRTGHLLALSGVPTPRIHALDRRCRFMAIEDAGDRALYHEAVGSFAAEAGYRAVVELIRRIQAIRPERVAAWNPPLARDLFEFEWAQTWRLFWSPALRQRPDLASRLEQVLDELLDLLAEEPMVVSHRDLMSRNVQLTSSGVLLLDHQDLRLGPAGYDLASLLHDSSRLSERQREQLERAHLSTSADVSRGHRSGGGDSPLATSRGYWLCVGQRMGKIVGTFCAFALSGGRRHLPMIPAALDSFVLALERTGLWPEAAEELLPELLAHWSANLDDQGSGARV